MSAVAARRGKRKMLKPKVSFGSSSGASSNLPRHQRRVPEENGPSLEEDLLEKLEPEKARRVLAEYDILISFLEHRAAFRHLHEDLHSFIYYENPNDDGDCYYPSSTTVPLADLCDGLSTMALGAKRRVPEENGPSLEEDLLEKLEPEKARRVLAEYDILISFLEHRAAFRHLHEDLHSFIYYENPNDDGDCYYPSSTTVPLADLCDGLSTMALGAKMAVIAGGETGEPAYGAGGTVSMQKNKANAAGDCDTSPCRYLPEVDTDDTVMIWCSRSQPCQMTQSVPGAFLVEVEQARSSSCGSGHDGLDDEKQGEEGSSQIRDDNGDRLRVDRPVGYAASVGAPPKVLRGHRRHRGNARL
ncbi:hypothetical protein HPB50_028376 [Hyalomma asiaticum]|nr:hypothetical protein HPB50_028376 [Hyalomma asiaticum]